MEDVPAAAALDAISIKISALFIINFGIDVTV